MLKFNWVEENASLENYNTYGIKTKTKYLIKPGSEKELKEIIDYLNQKGILYYVLGKGSNVLLSDSPFKGAIISLERLKKVEIIKNKVYAEAGVVLSNLVNTCINNNLSGLECLSLIPGSLGGALWGNAGCYGVTIYDKIESVTILEDGLIKTLKKSDIKIGYRNTEFKDKNVIILAGVFKLSFGDKENMLKIVKENRTKRLVSQPLEYKNAGSVFKNPEGNFAGALIESCNLKGYRINDACVSEKHANFIINLGKATGEDIRQLIKHIQNEVYKKYQIKLELEQKVIDW